MRAAVESHAEEPEDVVWLRKQVVGLFKQAKDVDEPDHAVCVKYAEILLKLLPRAGGGGGAQDVSKAVAAARQAVADRVQEITACPST
jgi:hypothetical protein